MPAGKLPSDHHSDRAKRALVLGPVKAGLARAEHEERLVRRPTLTGFCGAAVSKSVGRTKKRLRKKDVCVALPKPLTSPIQGLLGVHSRYGLHTRAVTVYRDTLSEGFSHFVTSMTAPVASGWSGCRVGLAPTGKRRLLTAHANCGLMHRSKITTAHCRISRH